MLANSPTGKSDEPKINHPLQHGDLQSAIEFPGENLGNLSLPPVMQEATPVLKRVIDKNR
jgi:hypothetical protein